MGNMKIVRTAAKVTRSPRNAVVFEADAEGHRDSILTCTALFLGPVAREIMLGCIGDGRESKSELATRSRSRNANELADKLGAPRLVHMTDKTVAVLINWNRCLTAAGIGHFYHPKQQPTCGEFGAFGSCLALGILESRLQPEDIIAGGRSLDTTLFRGVGRFFVTPSKYMGIAPAVAKHDDLLVILVDARVPLVIRRRENAEQENDYVLIGAGYLHGDDVLQTLREVHEGKRTSEETRVRLY